MRDQRCTPIETDAATTPHPEDLLTPDEVGTLVHYNAATVYGWCASGQLRHVRNGRKLLVKRRWVWEMMDGLAVGGEQPTKQSDYAGSPDGPADIAAGIVSDLLG